MTNDNAEAKERIWVGVRIRPLNKLELTEGDKEVWTVENESTLRYSGPADPKQKHLPAAFLYNRVFPKQSSNAEVYQTTCRPLVLAAMQGLNATIFAYGQTGSGKTYTMRSIMESAAQDVFAYIAENPDREFVLRISALEIYNESVRDLLRDKADPIAVFDHPERGLVAEGLSDEGIASGRQLVQLLRAVERRRHVRDTRLNDSSSRSHQIVRIHVESSPRLGTMADPDDMTVSMQLSALADLSDALPTARGGTTIAQLNFVDLAGSERIKAAAVEDQYDSVRMKEGSHINQSLLTLGKVIRRLADGRDGHVPFRESKLTRLLQPALGGNSKTAIVCCISPAGGSVENSRTALHFATAAKRVETRPRVNKVLDDKTLIRQLHDEIADLRRQLALVDTDQISARLQAMQRDARMTAGERDAATKRLRNLEKLILRAPPGSIRRRASWSPGPRVAGGGGSAAAGDAPHPEDSMFSSGAWTPGSAIARKDEGPAFNAFRSGQGYGYGHESPLPLRAARGMGMDPAHGLRSSWSPGDTARRISYHATALVAAQPFANDPASAERLPRRRLRFREPLFLDIVLEPKVTSRVRALGGGVQSRPAGQSTAPSDKAAPPAPADSTEALAARLQDMDMAPQGKMERDAIEALRAEVRAMKHGSGPIWPEGADDQESTIARLKEELRRMEEEAVIGEFLDLAKEETIRILRTELERATAAWATKGAADDALASLEERVRNLPLALDVSGLYEAGLAVLQGQLQSDGSRDGYGGTSGASSRGAGLGAGAASDAAALGAAALSLTAAGRAGSGSGSSPTRRHHMVPLLALGRLGGEFQEHEGEPGSYPVLESDGSMYSTLPTASSAGTPKERRPRGRFPLAGGLGDQDKENASSPLAGAGAGFGRGAGGLRASTDNLPRGEKKADKDKEEADAAPNPRSVRAQVAAAWQAAQDWYQAELYRVQAEFQVAAESDLESIKSCLGEQKEHVARLDCQKKFLLNRVLLAECSLRDAQALEAQLYAEVEEERARADDADRRAQEALTKVKRLEQASLYATPRVAHKQAANGQNAAAAAVGASVNMSQGSMPLGAAAAAAAPPASTPQSGRVPRLNIPPNRQNSTLSLMENNEDDPWADEPTEENLLPRIVRLWDELHVPLRHRSRFLLAFRGKETFYFEAEERRLSWVKARIQAEGSQTARMRKLGEARASLEGERKKLARIMKKKVPLPDREQLFLAWGIPVESKERKVQLMYKLWSSESLSSWELLSKASEFICRLYGDSPNENTEELVFFPRFFPPFMGPMRV